MSESEAADCFVVSVDRRISCATDLERNRGAMSRRQSWQSVSHEDVALRGSDCAIRTVNLNGVAFFACVLITASWVLDELWDAFTANGAHEGLFASVVPQRGATSLALLARAGLCLVVLFVAVVWSASAYIRIRYLSPSSKDLCERTFPSSKAAGAPAW